MLDGINKKIILAWFSRDRNFIKEVPRIYLVRNNVFGNFSFIVLVKGCFSFEDDHISKELYEKCGYLTYVFCPPHPPTHTVKTSPKKVVFLGQIRKSPRSGEKNVYNKKNEKITQTLKKH